MLAPSICGLQEMVNKMNDSVKKRNVKENVGKTKVMVFERAESTTECDILIEVTHASDGTYSNSRVRSAHRGFSRGLSRSTASPSV
ncbi:hypothetical protein EVAR_91596_1 [Eumeta japonica]|uniref:Uncharacterized protein n=1 Tax=Eumeta variegata TaxID=151549 RepID=A0A4C1UWN6_EUMVA|nr:hypothetical protein EVAR_91596_1 [Eumeta japonica]